MRPSKILMGNRGEIACRVMRAAHRLGYRTVAVFSDADAHALHVRQADEAVRIGAAPAADPYLNIPALLAAAQATAADAVHPGYGFLSERADFAQACIDAGLVFIGPPPGAIASMGDKAGAKRLMHTAGVPCVPGYLGDLPEALAGARREALSAFGDGTLMLERLVAGGRHIEIQVFADTQGHVVHLGERDCTAQRRRQKVIEESPSPVLSPALREPKRADAIAAAQAKGYVGAGTVEFIVDAQHQHYFLEMNALLVAEDPYDDWKPLSGRIARWRPAQAALRAGSNASRPASVAQFDLALHCRGQAQTLRVPPGGVTLLSADNGEARYAIGGVQRRALFADDGCALHLALAGAVFTFTETSPWPAHTQASDARRACAPVAGVVSQVRVAPGDAVAAGQQLVCIEAMKMEMWLTAGAAVYLPDGSRAAGNGVLIEALAACARRAGTGVASPTESRARLGLHAGAPA